MNKQTRCIDNQIYYLLDGIEDTAIGTLIYLVN
jgi:hypothetical protein